jgi:hypothetical protein
MFKRLVLAISVLGLIAGGANAQGGAVQISQIYGKILVGQGKGYQKPRDGMALQVGDTIFIGHKSGVTVLYVADNCTVNYTSPAVIKIAGHDDIPCLGSAPVQQIQAAPEPLPFVPPPAPALDILPLALGGVAIIGGGAALYFLTRPISASAS